MKEIANTPPYDGGGGDNLHSWRISYVSLTVVPVVKCLEQCGEWNLLRVVVSDPGAEFAVCD